MPAAAICELRSLEEYRALREEIAPTLLQRRAIEAACIRRDQESFAVQGFCAVCRKETEFVSSFQYACQTNEAGEDIPNWREHMACSQCGLVNRTRASLHVFYEQLQPRDGAKIYLTEQATSLYRMMRERHPNLVGSEFLDDRCAFGAEAGGLRNEDLLQLTFASDRFDFVLSFDVMEHVTDDVQAMAEIFRCLKPGGTFLFTAPFAASLQEKVIRARVLPDKSIEHIMAPEYHGNPVSEDGALCFRYLAWDAMDDLRSVGFENCRALFYWSRGLGYFGDHQFLLLADKPASSAQ